MKRPRDIDSAERVLVIRVAALIGLPLLFLVVYAQSHFFPDRVWWLVGPDVVGVSVLVAIVWRFIRGAGVVAGSVTWPRGTPPVREYSEQQALIERGLIADAIASYRSHLIAFPADIEARLRLAALLGDAGDVDGAERTYRDVRALNPAPQQEWIAANGLIDLYRAAGRRVHLKAELARFARRYRDTTAGKSALIHLRQLQREDARVELSE